MSTKGLASANILDEDYHARRAVAPWSEASLPNGVDDVTRSRAPPPNGRAEDTPKGRWRDGAVLVGWIACGTD